MATKVKATAKESAALGGYSLDELSTIFKNQDQDERLGFLYGHSHEVLKEFAAAIGVPQTGPKPQVASRILMVALKHESPLSLVQESPAVDEGGIPESGNAEPDPASEVAGAVEVASFIPSSAITSTSGGIEQRRRFRIRASIEELDDDDLDRTLSGWANLRDHDFRGLSRDQKLQLNCGYLDLIAEGYRMTELPPAKDFIANIYMQPKE